MRRAELLSSLGRVAFRGIKSLAAWRRAFRQLYTLYHSNRQQRGLVDPKKAISNELRSLVAQYNPLLKARQGHDLGEFTLAYQKWYTRAVKAIASLAPDRLEEFRSFYLPNPKRKSITYESYTIQDYLRGIDAPRDGLDRSEFEAAEAVERSIVNQMFILRSVFSRVDDVLADIEGTLLADFADRELEAAAKLSKVSVRAAGALAGVVLERHLQRLAQDKGVKIGKSKPTIADLNDPLRAAGVYDTPVWRKIQFLADIRNLCSHSKGSEPTPDQFRDLLHGVESVIRTVS